ncbi:MAG: hypothetical protein ACQERJ_08395 [Bacillota bacterium]
MEKYIGILSIIYILIAIGKLKDNKKSFQQHLEEFKAIKSRMELIAQQRDPFIMMKFLTSVFYFFLFLYYIANLIFFEQYLLINVVTYILILISAYRLGRKLLINSIADLEEVVKYEKDDYKKKRNLDFVISLIEFGYAFNALSLLSLYY